MTKQQKRLTFNSVIANRLAGIIRVDGPWAGKGSRRFAYFADKDALLVVAGAQEESEVDLAFAYGLTYREGRRLVLALPEGLEFPTLQRAPWFKEDARPEIWIHDGTTARQIRLPSQLQTVRHVAGHLKRHQPPEDELREAAQPLHLGHHSDALFELAEWATKHQMLDPGHRRGERAWHCMGQKVLSLSAPWGHLEIAAGIHRSGAKPIQPWDGSSLERASLVSVQAAVEKAIVQRLEGAFHRPDEHWLQAVIRRDPSLVGVEQPALRELPVWRPRQDITRPQSKRKDWSRGFLDLVGVDGHGNIRLVETKLADNRDDLLVLQGLDYYVWAQAYQDVLRGRLGAAPEARTEIHYVIGDTVDGKVRLSRFAAAQAQNLDPVVPWRFQTIRDWFSAPSGPAPPSSHLLPEGTLPQDE